MHQTKNEVGTAQITKGEKKEKGKGILSRYSTNALYSGIPSTKEHFPRPTTIYMVELFVFPSYYVSRGYRVVSARRVPPTLPPAPSCAYTSNHSFTSWSVIYHSISLFPLLTGSSFVRISAGFSFPAIPTIVSCWLWTSCRI